MLQVGFMSDARLIVEIVVYRHRLLRWKQRPLIRQLPTRLPTRLPTTPVGFHVVNAVMVGLVSQRDLPRSLDLRIRIRGRRCQVRAPMYRAPMYRAPSTIRIVVRSAKVFLGRVTRC